MSYLDIVLLVFSIIEPLKQEEQRDSPE